MALLSFENKEILILAEGLFNKINSVLKLAEQIKFSLILVLSNNKN